VGARAARLIIASIQPDLPAVGGYALEIH
jgi:hypothetical protein